MATTIHKNLTGSDLHEPKGADTALAGYIYVSDGAGSGVWTLASAVITNTAFTTGDLKPTWKSSADTGWILWSDGTIGDGSSGGSVRANADTSALFVLMWTVFSNTLAPVSGGRGGSAASDFAAHKTISIPVGAGRALGIAGSGASLTTRAVGASLGTETATLITANLPAYTPSGSVATTSTLTLFHGTGVVSTTTGSAGVNFDAVTAGSGTLTNAASTGTLTGTAQGGTSTAFSIMQPSVFVNVMVKL